MDFCKIGWFVGGVAAGCVIGKMAGGQKPKDMCVDMLARGMELKAEAQTAIEDMKNKAEDIYQ